MKEASGELSMTAVAVVAIGAIAVLFTTLILPGLRQNIKRNTYCSQAYNCGKDPNEKGLVSCSYLDEDDNVKNIDCKLESGK